MNQPLILIVEDDPKLAKIFSLALESAGYRTEFAFDGASALEKAPVLQPALILLDLHLPFVSGREVMKQLKANPRMAQTKFIISSADSGLANQLREKADLVLLKPVSIGQLRRFALRLVPVTE